jgi:hypothetical protein
MRGDPDFSARPDSLLFLRNHLQLMAFQQFGKRGQPLFKPPNANLAELLLENLVSIHSEVSALCFTTLLLFGRE